MARPDELIEPLPLDQEDKNKLDYIARNMPLVADISRSDMLLYACHTPQTSILLGKAAPHSTVSVRAHHTFGQRVTILQESTLFKALRQGIAITGNRRMIDRGAPVIQRIRPIRGHNGQVIGALSIEATLIADVRQKARSKVFQRAVHLLQTMLLAGELHNGENLSCFTENDGIMVVDHQRIIRYLSGIATEQYRKLGYLDNLVGRHLSTLETGDERMAYQVLETCACAEQTFEERQRIWVRKAIPLVGFFHPLPWNRPWLWFRRAPVGVLFTIHDATEEQKKERELKIKSAMICEIHHRVKNNLQTVAAILRIQMRRSPDPSVKQALKDSVQRVMSMAVVHEYLSREESQAINIREVARRIIQETQEGVLGPDKQIQIRLEPGNNLYLPGRQATACALIINELLQNAVEHGFEEQNNGVITIDLQDLGQDVCIVIHDDGAGLPADFDLSQTTSMGLQIVRTLVKDDLRGDIQIASNGGVRAIIRFSKKVLEGEELWNGNGSS